MIPIDMFSVHVMLGLIRHPDVNALDGRLKSGVTKREME